MRKIIFNSYSAKDTIELASRIAGSLKKGDTIGLFGDLGSGKTTFVKGLAAGLGLKSKVNSPSFVILKIYPPSHKNMGLLVDECEENASADFTKWQYRRSLQEDNPTKPKTKVLWRRRVHKGATGLPMVFNSASRRGAKNRAVRNKSAALCHFDLYRLKSLRELEDIGYEDFIGSDVICVIEWADRADGLLPKDCLKVKIKIKPKNSRIINISSYGGRHRNLLKDIKSAKE